MLFEQRKQQIMQLLMSQQTVTVQELVEKIGASESTLRRDLILLEDQELLSRVHGGATLVKAIGTEQNMAERTNINRSLKAIVGAFGSKLIQVNSQIFIDAGTATLELVRQLPNEYPVQIVTNGLDQALLAVQKGIAVTLLGGPVKPVTHAIAGITAYQQLAKMNFAFAFIGMNGLSFAKGLTTTNIEEASLKECAMQQSQHIRILMDESKIGQFFEYKVDAPSQAIVLLNANAGNVHPEEMKHLNTIFDLQLVND